MKQRAALWRNSFGSTAVVIVSAYFNQTIIVKGVETRVFSREAVADRVNYLLGRGFPWQWENRFEPRPVGEVCTSAAVIVL